MHQTLYIDIDEEITSIVDRLKKVRTDEAVIVVPKRAMLIQSIVNLKLLKKEAENLELQIMIVTQDKLGKMLVEKAGILAQNKLDDIESEEEVIYEDRMEKEKSQPPKQKKKNEVKDLGSDSYFSEPQSKSRLSSAGNRLEEEKEEFEKLVNTELVTDISNNIKEKKGLFSRSQLGRNSVPMDMVRGLSIEEGMAAPVKKEKKKKKIAKEVEIEMEETENENDKISSFFNNSYRNQITQEEPEIRERKRKKDELKNVSISGKFWKFFLIFSSTAILAVALLCAFLFLPKAEVKIATKGKTQSIDLDLEASASRDGIDYESEIIPAKEIVINQEFSKNFPTSGEKSASNQKARGTITIYNEFSTISQPLVATTRFLSENEKIFRLVSGVTVPGMTKQDGEIKPGVIEAEVVADESGAEYNIDPGKFTIPGFQSSGAEKYAKFYAKSTKAMTGGGEGGTQIRTISENDINSAKSKMVAEMNKEILSKLKENAGNEWIVLEDAYQVEEPVYKTSNLVGDAVESFTLTVNAKVRALAFRESDIKELASSSIIKSRDSQKIDSDEIVLEFGKSELDLERKYLGIKAHINAKVRPNIDLENLKVGILGKNEEQLKAYLTTYSDIQEASVDYWPSFISGKIPAYASRVTVTLDKN